MGHMPNYKKVIKLSGVYALGNMAQSAVSFFLLPLFALYLGPSDLGVLSLIIISTTLLSTVVNSASAGSLTRYFYHIDFQSKRGEFVFSLFIFTVIKSLLTGLLFLALSRPFCLLVFGNLENLQLVRYSSLLVFLSPLSTFFLVLLKISEKAVFYIITNIVSMLFTILLVFFLLEKGYGMYSVIWGQTINLLMLSLFVVYYFLKISKPALHIRLLYRPLKYAYPLTFSNLSQILFDAGDRYILKIFVSIKEIGLYDLGYRVAGLFNIVIGKPLYDALSPMVFQSEKNHEALKSFLCRYAIYYYILGMWAALAFSLFADSLLNLMMLDNPEFIGAAKVMPYIILASAWHGLGYFLGWGIIIKEKSWTVSMIMFVALVANIGLNFVFIPLFGMVGAAIATLISYLVWNVLKMYYSAKYFQLYFNLNKLLIVTAISILLYVLGTLGSYTQSHIAEIFIKLVVVCLYPCYFIASGFLVKQEKQMLRNKWNEFIKRILLK
jgi:O-antigen/teichoic acid export membrane protein